MLAEREKRAFKYAFMSASTLIALSFKFLAGAQDLQGPVRESEDNLIYMEKFMKFRMLEQFTDFALYGHCEAPNVVKMLVLRGHN